MQQRFDHFEFDATDGRIVNRDDGRSLRLRPQAATVLEQLLRAGGEVVERERLREVVWGEDRIVDFEAGLAALIRELRKAIAELGGAETLIETLPRRGYRLHAEVSPVDAADRGNDDSDDENRIAPTRRIPRRALIIMIVALTALVAVATAMVFWRGPEEPEQETAVPAVENTPSLAIVPFEVYGETPLWPEHVSILLADTVLAELWRTGPEDLALLGRIAIQPYLDRRDIAAAVAEDLGLTLLLEGTLRAENQRWWLDLRLLRIPPGEVLWTYRIENTEPLNVTEVARNLAQQLRRRWPEIRDDGEPSD